jgi:hypothetical protein
MLVRVFLESPFTDTYYDRMVSFGINYEFYLLSVIFFLILPKALLKSSSLDEVSSNNLEDFFYYRIEPVFYNRLCYSEAEKFISSVYLDLYDFIFFDDDWLFILFLLFLLET